MEYKYLLTIIFYLLAGLAIAYCSGKIPPRDEARRIKYSVWVSTNGQKGKKALIRLVALYTFLLLLLMFFGN